ncbi:MAG: hypothetical protein AVDCRST_MAG53-3245, partial [uncultured Solirubrobacteraceae bacterium]
AHPLFSPPARPRRCGRPARRGRRRRVRSVRQRGHRQVRRREGHQVQPGEPHDQAGLHGHLALPGRDDEAQRDLQGRQALQELPGQGKRHLLRALHQARRLPVRVHAAHRDEGRHHREV